jgi:hypothetical protein
VPQRAIALAAGRACVGHHRFIEPYLVLLVELDAQSGKPTKEEGLRVIGNPDAPDGVLAPTSEGERVGIGTRVRTKFAGANAAAMDY